MKKVLLVDTNVSSFPIYKSLVERGHDVYVMGSKSTDCLSKYTKNYINCDYSNIELLKKKIKEYNFDYVVPGANDLSYLSFAKINSEFKYEGVDTFENSEIINNKIKFRKFALSHNLHTPKIFTKQELNNIKGPVIIKPVDAYSGRGVTIVKDNNEENIDIAIQTAIKFSNSKSYLIEEYVEGQLYSHSAFVSNKKIIQDFIVIEDCSANPFTVDTSHVIYDFNKKMLNDIRTDIEKMSYELNLVDGLIHTQFIKTKNSFKIIEVTRRCPGDLYSLLIEKSTGFNYADYYVRSFINEDINVKRVKLQRNNIIRHTISMHCQIPFIGVKYDDTITTNLFIPLITTGDELKQSPFGRVGLLFINCKSKKELSKINNKILTRKLYSIE